MNYTLTHPRPDKIAQKTTNRYKFGFNGMEKDNAVKGEGNSYDFGARIYDSRLGRWMTSDPLFMKYPYSSPYVYTNNTPVYYREIQGKDYGVYIDHKNKTITIKATYYTTALEQSATEDAAKVWNDQSDKFIYRTGSGDEYSIKFDLKVDITAKNNAQAELLSSLDKEGNSVVTVTSDAAMPVPGGNDLAQTVNGKEITLNSTTERSNTRAHEIGHTLGVQHQTGKNLMTRGDSELKSDTKVITPGMIANVLATAGVTHGSNQADLTKDKSDQELQASPAQTHVDHSNDSGRSISDKMGFKKGNVTAK